MISAPSTSSPRPRREAKTYYGKYRGVVVNNLDPNGLARVQVQVAAISASPMVNWALPCSPVGGPQHGMVTVPPIGAGVWIEFEQGDPDYPIWTGCFWGSSAEVPSRSGAVYNKPLLQSITLQTPLQHSVVISDMPGPLGGIQIRTATEARVFVTDTGIDIDNGKGASIQLIGPAIIFNAPILSFNNGALTIRS